MRLFFAVLIPEEIIARVSEVQGELRAAIGDEGIRWTRPEQFHYTIKFLGSQPPAKLNMVLPVAQAVRESIEPFDLRLTGIGAFPNANRPGTLWIGASDGAEAITRLADQLDQQLHSEGFAREKRGHTAHLTLARIKSYAGETAAAKRLKTTDVGDLGIASVDRFVLMESKLKPTGSEYTVVEEFLLSRSDGVME